MLRTVGFLFGRAEVKARTTSYVTVIFCPHFNKFAMYHLKKPTHLDISQCLSIRGAHSNSMSTYSTLNSSGIIDSREDNQLHVSHTLLT